MRLGVGHWYVFNSEDFPQCPNAEHNRVDIGGSCTMPHIKQALDWAAKFKIKVAKGKKRPTPPPPQLQLRKRWPQPNPNEPWGCPNLLPLPKRPNDNKNQPGEAVVADRVSAHQDLAPDATRLPAVAVSRSADFDRGTRLCSL